MTTSFILDYNNGEIKKEHHHALNVKYITHHSITNESFTDINIRDKAFTSLCFLNCKFKHVNFEDCEFKEVQFNNCYFENCTFTNCVLNCNYFTRGSIANTKFTNTTFEHVYFANTHFRNNFSDVCRYLNTTFENIISNCTYDAIFNGCCFKECNINSTNFKDSYFTGNIIIDSYFIKVLFNSEKIKTDNILTHNRFRNVQFSSNIVAFISKCPSEGEFIGYKKLAENRIAKLKIPANAFRSCSGGYKCRASRVKVLDIFDADDFTIKYTEGYSNHSSTFKYVVGKYKEVKDFDMLWSNQCSTGIHFFMDLQSAIEY